MQDKKKTSVWVGLFLFTLLSGMAPARAGSSKLAEFIPLTEKVPWLGDFVSKRVQQDDEKIVITGRLFRNRKVTVTQYVNRKTSFQIAVLGKPFALGEIVKAADFIPAAFRAITYSNHRLEIRGTLNFKPVQITQELDDHRLTLTGAGLQLKDLLPQLPALKALNLFAFHSLTGQKDALTIDGMLHGHPVEIALAAPSDEGPNFSLTGNGLTLHDFVPNLPSLSLFNRYAFSALHCAKGDFVLSGTLSGKETTLQIRRDDGQGMDFTLTGEQLIASDFIPALKKLPVLTNFGFKAFHGQKGRFSLDGTIHEKDASISIGTTDTSGTAFDLTGANLTLTDLVPDARLLPALNRFGFQSLHYRKGTFTLDGTIHDKAAELTILRVDGNALDFTVTGEQLQLSDFIPAAKSLSALNRFGFKQLHFDQQSFTLAGSIQGKDATIALKRSDEGKIDFTVTGADLKVTDFIPAAGTLPVFNNFGFESLHCRKGAFSLAGTLHSKAATLDIDIRDGLSFTLTGANLTLPDFIPATRSLPALAAFGFKELNAQKGEFSFAGTVSGKDATVRIDQVAEAGIDFTLVGSDLKLADFIAAAQSLSTLNEFGFESLHYRKGAFSIIGSVSGKAAAADLEKADATGNSFTLSGEGLTVADFIPAVKSVHLLNEFAFDRLHCEKGEFSLSGSISGKAASLDLLKPQATGMEFTLTGAQLELSDFLPSAGKLQVLNAFAFDRLHYQKGRIDLLGEIRSADNGAMKSVALQINRSTATGTDFTLTGAGLTVGDLLPIGHSCPELNVAHFDALTYAGSSGKVMVKGTLGPQNKPFEIDVVMTKADASFTLTSRHLTLADLLPATAGLPGVDILGFDSFELTRAYIEVELDLKGHSARLIHNNHKKILSVYLEELGASMFLPIENNEIIDQLVLKNLLFVQSTAPLLKLLPTDLPESIRPKINFGAGTGGLRLPKGLNLTGQANNVFKKVLTRIGIDLPSLPMRGSLPKQLFARLKHKKGNTPTPDSGKGSHHGDSPDGHGDSGKGGGSQPAPDGGSGSGGGQSPHLADKLAFLKGVSLTVDLALPKIPEVDRFVVFHDLHLTIGGDASIWDRLPAAMAGLKPAGEIDLSLQGGMTVTLDTFKENLDLLIDLSADGASETLTMIGLAEGEWKDPFGIRDFTLMDMGLEIKLTESQQKKQADQSLFSTASLHGKENVGVTANFEEGGGLPKLKYFELDGPIALSDFTHNLPHGSNIILHKLWLYPTGIEADAEIKIAGFDDRNKLYLFEVEWAGRKDFVAAIDVNTSVKTGARTHFSLGRLGRIAGLQGKHSSLIQSRLDGMAVANAALILSSRKMFPVSPASLTDGVAKDMFTGIFGDSQIPIAIDNVSFASDFRVDLMGEIGDKLVNGVKGLKLGLSEEAIINGTIGGLFDGDPLTLDLEFLMGASFSLDHLTQAGLKLPKFLKASPDKVGGGEKAGLFIKIVDEVLEAGLICGYDATFNKTTFDFTGTLGIQLADEEIGISLSGAMSDNWKDALGIQGFELENVTISGELEADPPSIKFGLGGETTIMETTLSAAGDIIVGLAAEVPIPEGIGIKTTSNSLDVQAYEVIDTICLVANADDVLVPPLWPVIIIGTAIEVGVAESYTLIYDKVKGKKVKAKDLAKAPLKDLALFQSWLLGGKNVGISFATPGASDANLGIPGGIHMTGDIELFGGLIKSPKIQPSIEWVFKIANAVSSVKAKGSTVLNGETQPTKIRIPGKALRTLRQILAYEFGLTRKRPAVSYPKPSAKEIDDFLSALRFTQSAPFKLGGIEFSNNRVSLIPFKVRSTAKLFDAEEEVLFSASTGKLVFEADTTFKKLGNCVLRLEHDQAKDDFLVEGRFQAGTFSTWLEGEVESGVTELVNLAIAEHGRLSKELSKLKGDVSKAQTAVEAEARKVTAFIDNAPSVRKAESDLEDAKQGIGKAQAKLDKLVDKAVDDLGRWAPGWAKRKAKKKAKKLFGYLVSDAEQALSGAKTALEDAKNLVAIPKALTNEVASAKAGLKKVLGKKREKESLMTLIEGAEGYLTQSLTDQVKSRLKKTFILKEVGFVGGFKDGLQGKPFIAELKYTLAGEDKSTFLAIRPDAPDYTAKSFALMPALTLEAILKKVGGGDPKSKVGKIHTWLLATVHQQVSRIQKDVHKSFGTETAEYRKILESFLKESEGLSKARDRFVTLYGEHMSRYTLTDMMPPSRTFKNRYLAVGHSSLCLGVAPNGVDVIQENGRDIDAERWSTRALDNGYVALMCKGLCLKAKSKTAGSGEPLILAELNRNDPRDHWKVISSDGFYVKIINRYSQKALHFDTENANPHSAYATWTSPLGADSQTFRILEDAERAAWHAVKERLKAQNGMCLAVSPNFMKYFHKTSKGHPTLTAKAYKQMIARGDDLLRAVPCTDQAGDRFNYLEEVNGEIKIVHVDSGWGLVPAHRGDHPLRLAPCNRNPDMFWRPQAKKGQYVTLVNGHFNRVLTLPAGSQAHPTPGARLAPASDDSAQLIDFVK